MQRFQPLSSSGWRKKTSTGEPLPFPGRERAPPAALAPEDDPPGIRAASRFLTCPSEPSPPRIPLLPIVGAAAAVIP